MKHTILFLHGENFCYGSIDYFSRRISYELSKQDWQVEHVTCPKNESDAILLLQSYYNKNYDIVFDVNTLLPSLCDEDGLCCVNRIGKQIWHYILDHPLYHHSVFVAPPDNFHVICLDETHAEYLRNYYPLLTSVHCLPLPAEQADTLVPYPERKYDIIFTGTYTESEHIHKQALAQEPMFTTLFKHTTALLLDQPVLTLEEATVHCLQNMYPNHIEKIHKILPQIMQSSYLTDMYLRALLREELLIQLLNKNVPVSVFGHNWSIFQEKCERQIPQSRNLLTLHSSVPYMELPNIYTNTKIALNQLPWFKNGMHDRIPMAMMNGCVCITDSNNYLENRLVDGEQLYFYSLEDMSTAADLLTELLKNPDTAAKTAARGYTYALHQYNWRHWTQTWLALIL